MLSKKESNNFLILNDNFKSRFQKLLKNDVKKKIGLRKRTE